MFRIVLLSLALTGLQALPISRRLTKTHHNLPLEVQDGLTVPLSEGFRQGTEPSRRFIVDLNTGLVQDYISKMNRRTGLLSPSLGNGNGEMDRKHWLRENTAEEVPVQKIGGGWLRLEGHAKIPDGFRQGTEPSQVFPEGFRQGTEPAMPIHVGYRQGTERFMPIPDGFRQGTEPFMRIQDGFRQGTEPSLGIQKGFRQGTERFMPILDSFRQGTEPSQSIPNGFRQGTEPTNPKNDKEVAISLNTKEINTIPNGFRQGTERSSLIPHGFRQGTERFMPVPHVFRQGTEPALYIRDGFRQGTEPAMPMRNGYRQGTEHFIPIPDGFRQGTERFMPIPDGFRQGTEPYLGIPNGFRQGTEPSSGIPDGFRQGTKRFMPFPDGFRQGTEPTNPLDHKDVALSFKDLPAVPSNQILKGFKPGAGPFMPVWDGDRQDTQSTERFIPISDGFRQGTEPTNLLRHKDVALSFKDLPAVPSNQILESFKPGAGPFMPVRDSDRQDTQPSNHIQTNPARCNGEVVNGRCYAFNPTPMPFLEAQDSCKSLNPNAELAAVTSEDLHSRLVSMVTNRGQRDPVMTWLGGTVKNQRGSWLDGSEWRYSDWMPGQPNIHTDKPICVEMFRMDETWWSAADCDLKRASICSYPVAA